MISCGSQRSPLAGFYCINITFPKADHSGNDARIVLRQNKFSKKVTSNRDWTLKLMMVVFLHSCLSNYANCQVLIEGSLTPPLFVHLYLLERIQQKKTWYRVRIFKVSVFQEMGIDIAGWAWDLKYYIHRVEGSSPVKGSLLPHLFCSNTILAFLPEWST